MPNAVPVILDANVLWKPALRNRLTEKVKLGVLQVYVPTLVHAERIRQIAHEKGEAFAIDTIKQLVEASLFQLLPFEVADAEAVAEIWLALKAKGSSNDDWKQHRFDILLCAIAQARGYTLITDDKGLHFEAVSARMNTVGLQNWLEQLSKEQED